MWSSGLQKKRKRKGSGEIRPYAGLDSVPDWAAGRLREAESLGAVHAPLGAGRGQEGHRWTRESGRRAGRRLLGAVRGLAAHDVSWAAWHHVRSCGMKAGQDVLQEEFSRPD